MEKIRVMIVDDHQLVRDGIIALLQDQEDIEIAGEANNGDELFAIMATVEPHIILMDISLPGKSGIDLTKELSKLYPRIFVLILSMYTHEDFVINAIKAGARGYLPKNTTRKELLTAIHTIINGEEYFNEEISRLIMKSVVKSAKAENNGETGKEELTKREIEIIKLFAEGLSNQDIAEKLFISVRTVESHKNHIMQKLGLKNNIDLVKYCIRNGILEV
jgi:DNA-binding NarL/FixJ family response regulator